MALLSIEELIANTPDRDLLEIEYELINGISPATGYAHAFVRDMNKKIDAGTLQFNERGRHVYLPTIAKLVKQELARRYVLAIQHGLLKADMVTREVALAKGQVPGQLRLDLEGTIDGSDEAN